MKKYIIALLTTFFSVSFAWADNPKAVLTYVDNAEEIEVYDFTGTKIENIYMGYPLLIGYGIKTRKSTAELEMEPNGSIINLQENSFMKIEEMQGPKNAKSNRFTLMKGLFRMVASRLFNANYTVKTPSTVLGVRGTDFSISVGPESESDILVQEGKVEVYDPSTRNSIVLEPGEGASVRPRMLQKIDMEMQEVKRRVELFTFKALAPESVPREVPDDYDIEFDYFSDIEYKEFKEFFADENFFDDADLYLEKFRDYYSSEMSDFQERFEEEQESFETYRKRQFKEYSKYKNWY